MIRAALPLIGLVGCAGDDPVLPTPPTPPECTEAPGEICTIVGSGARGFNGGGLGALETHLFLPTAVTFEPDGHLVVVDYNNQVVRRLEWDGTLTTLAGTGVHAYAADGAVATETTLENPVSADIAPDGTLFVMEQHGARVLKVDPAGWLTVYAGDPVSPGVDGFRDGPAREARMSQSVGLALGDDGSLYIADAKNHAIRVVDPLGLEMTTLAGDGTSGLVDGVGAEARFHQPQHLTFHDGFVYVADAYNHALRQVDVETGEVVTVAGTGAAGFSGDGGPSEQAQLNNPQGVAVDDLGRIYVADSSNHVIRRIDVDGTIETVVGRPGEFGFEGDFGDGAEAMLNTPTHVAVRGGELFVVDMFNDRIRCVYDFVDQEG